MSPPSPPAPFVNTVQILQDLAHGYSQRQIAVKRGCPLETIIAQVATLRDRWQVATTRDLLTHARGIGLIH